MNKYYYNKRIQQGAGHLRLSFGGEDIVIFDDGISYIDILGDKGFETDLGSFEDQVKYYESWLNSYEKRLKRLKGILEACKKHLNNDK